MRWHANLIGLAVACLLAASAANAKTFDSFLCQFTVEFPGGPLHGYIFRGWTARETPYDEYQWSASNKDCYWAVAEFVYGTPRKEDYDANIAGAVAGAKGRLVSQKRVQQRGMTGREIVIDGPNSVVIRERLL
jgi:hypothetical protein